MGLFRKKSTKKVSIDTEVEAAIQETKVHDHENDIIELFTRESSNDSKPAKYETSVKENPSKLKTALKNMYNTFLTYAKDVYTKTSLSVDYTKRKIIEGPVRITLLKLIRVWEYINAAINPQWNMPMLSKFDLDTLAPAITNHIIINEDNFQYESGYGAIRYRSH